MARPEPARLATAPVPTARLETAPAPSPQPHVAALSRGVWARAIAIGMLAFDAVALSWGRSLGPDTYISLTAGRWISAHGLPHTDHLSVAAAGKPWIDQQWLAHVLFYALWRIGGDGAVAASSALGVGLAIGLLYALCVRRGADMVSTWIGVGSALVVCLMFAETRSQSYAYPLFVGLLWIVLSELERGRFSRRALLVVPIIALWANLHGSVLVGAALAAGCFGLRGARNLVRRRTRAALPDLAVAVLALAAVLATPYGTAILGYYPRVLGDPALATIAEWQPSSFTIICLPFVAILLGLVGAAFYSRGRRLPVPAWPIAIAAVLGVLATHALRYQVWFAMAAAPVLALLVTQIRGRAGADSALPRRLAIAASVASAGAMAAVCAVLALTSTATYDSFVARSAVSAAAGYAQSHPTARVLADDSTGSALLWLHPGVAGRVGFDARTEIYPPARFLRFDRFLLMTGGSWTAATRGYQVLAITCGLHPGLCPAIRRLPDWRVIADRSGGLVAVRRA
jgi:hypothetical protein